MSGSRDGSADGSTSAFVAIVGNLVGYQMVWFAAVIGAGAGHAWPAVVAMVAFAAWQLSASPRRALDLRLMAAAVAMGVVLDGVLALGGLLDYATPAPALPAGGAPLWILALWAAFSLTVTRSLAWLRQRVLLGAALGAIGAPLAYLAAARGWNAVTFAPPGWPGLLWLAAGWAVAIPVLGALAGKGPLLESRLEARP